MNIDKLKSIPELNVEIIGSWIWITGETKKHKEQLKALGFWFSRKKCAWYYTGSKKHFRVKGKYNTLNEVRNQWGTTKINVDDLETI